MSNTKPDREVALDLFKLLAPMNDNSNWLWLAQHCNDLAVTLGYFEDTELTKRLKEHAEQTAQQAEFKEFLDKLSPRAANCLKAEGFKSVDEVCAFGGYQLIRLPNLGRVSLQEIREVLASMGKVLR